MARLGVGNSSHSYTINSRLFRFLGKLGTGALNNQSPFSKLLVSGHKSGLLA